MFYTTTLRWTTPTYSICYQQWIVYFKGQTNFKTVLNFSWTTRFLHIFFITFSSLPATDIIVQFLWEFYYLKYSGVINWKNKYLSLKNEYIYLSSTIYYVRYKSNDRYISTLFLFTPILFNEKKYVSHNTSYFLIHVFYLSTWY